MEKNDQVTSKIESKIPQVKTYGDMKDSSIKPHRVNMQEYLTKIENMNKSKYPLVFIMGPTGTGKSKLALDLAAHFPNAEIFNTTKSQFYDGLEVITNKVTEENRRGVPHHFIGGFGHDEELEEDIVCSFMDSEIAKTIEQKHIPIFVGSGNSIVEKLVESTWYIYKGVYECLFIVLNVDKPVLMNHLTKRVNRMVEVGLVDEAWNVLSVPVEEFPKPRVEIEFLDMYVVKDNIGARGLLGVQEMKPYFENEGKLDEGKLFETCVENITENTRNLVERQAEEIDRLEKKYGWEMHRVDATRVLDRDEEDDVELVYEELVLKPVLTIMKDFVKRIEEKNLEE